MKNGGFSLATEDEMGYVRDVGSGVFFPPKWLDVSSTAAKIAIVRVLPGR